jgi:hypothetical protein
LQHADQPAAHDAVADLDFLADHRDDRVVAAWPFGRLFEHLAGGDQIATNLSIVALLNPRAIGDNSRLALGIVGHIVNADRGTPAGASWVPYTSIPRS